MLPYPVIVVPGIAATKLRDMYQMPPEQIWGALGWKKKYERVALHPKPLLESKPTYLEYQEPSSIRTDEIFRVAYEELIEELREELSDVAGRQEVPVFPFSYDWRQPLEEIQHSLRIFIEEVVNRCSLLPHYQEQYGNNIKVNLIGHSMGGLVIARCLSDQSDPVPVNKVATLAAPFQGSFEAIVKLVIGTGNLTGDKPSHAERRTARATPSLYQLLPTFPLNEVFANDLNVDPKQFTNPQAWQPSIVNFLSDYITNTGLPIEDARAQANELFRRFLAGTESNKDAIAKLNLNRHGLNQNKWLAVVGVDRDTRVKIEVKKGVGGKPEYVFDHPHTMNTWDDEKPKKQWLMTGDGTVPLSGAIPPFLGREKLVLITPDDYGFWEVKDKVVDSLGGFHGILPNMNLVHRLLIRFFTNQTAANRDKYKNTWGRAMPDSVNKWDPPIKLGKPKNTGIR